MRGVIWTAARTREALTVLGLRVRVTRASLLAASLRTWRHIHIHSHSHIHVHMHMRMRVHMEARRTREVAASCD